MKQKLTQVGLSGGKPVMEILYAFQLIVTKPDLINELLLHIMNHIPSE